MAVSTCVSSLFPPTIPMMSPFKGAYGMRLEGHMITSNRVPMTLRYNSGKCYASLICTARKPMSVAVLSHRNQFGSLGMGLDHFSFRGTTLVPPRYQASRTVVSKALRSADKYTNEKKPRWWWRTLACIPYLMPLHVMSIYAEGAQRFLPFLQNFEILTDPFFGNQLPGWFMVVYCLGVYFFIVRRKQWPHFFRFHIIMAMLLDNAVQITGIVVGWMPYWSKIDASFWTVFACGLLIAMFGCIRGALRGTYANTPFFSEAAFIHTSLP